jgi:predicted ABC-type ATPase
MNTDKKFYIIAGCNGAGKTTASHLLLPDLLSTICFINADEIARQLNPQNVSAVAFKAGRIMLQNIEEQLSAGNSFTIETTLASRSYISKMRKAKLLVYNLIILYFWLPNSSLAISRVKRRVKNGGHHIDEYIIRRRYKRSLDYLFDFYIPLVDECVIFNNTIFNYDFIASKFDSKQFIVINQKIWKILNHKNHYSICH